MCKKICIRQTASCLVSSCISTHAQIWFPVLWNINHVNDTLKCKHCHMLSHRCNLSTWFTQVWPTHSLNVCLVTHGLTQHILSFRHDSITNGPSTCHTMTLLNSKLLKAIKNHNMSSIKIWNYNIHFYLNYHHLCTL